MDEFPEGYFDPLPILIPERIDVPDEPEPEYTVEQLELKKKREKAQRCKVIALSSLGLHPILTNVSSLQTKTKLKIIDLVKQLFEKDDEEIAKQFNDIVLSDVLNEEQDYTNYPVYQRIIKA